MCNILEKKAPYVKGEFLTFKGKKWDNEKDVHPREKEVPVGHWRECKQEECGGLKVKPYAHCLFHLWMGRIGSVGLLGLVVVGVAMLAATAVWDPIVNASQEELESFWVPLAFGIAIPYGFVGHVFWAMIPTHNPVEEW